jgi:Zn-dependent protease
MERAMPPSPLPTPIEEWQFELARQLAGVFHAEEWAARNGILRFRGRLLMDPDTAFAILSERLQPHGYVPQLNRPDEIILLRLPPSGAPHGAPRWGLPALLFAATLLTTFLAGATDFKPYEGIYDVLSAALGKVLGMAPAASRRGMSLDVGAGIIFAASLMGILGVHELGHYVTARRYGMRVSLPYFIPMPFGPMGTMGAIIRMRSPVPDRRALFDVGIAGPLGGLAVAIPVAAIGLHLSVPIPMPPALNGEFALGPSWLFAKMIRLMLGDPPTGSTIALHPMAVAGWLGLFVTALNLIPAGQLDGGHVAYAVLGRRHDRVALFIVLALFGIAVLFMQPTWFFWAMLLLVMGYRHPPPLNDLTRLDVVRLIIGVLCWGLFLILFTPVPFVF